MPIPPPDLFFELLSSIFRNSNQGMPDHPIEGDIKRVRADEQEANDQKADALHCTQPQSQAAFQMATPKPIKHQENQNMRTHRCNCQHNLQRQGFGPRGRSRSSGMTIMTILCVYFCPSIMKMAATTTASAFLLSSGSSLHRHAHGGSARAAFSLQLSRGGDDVNGDFDPLHDDNLENNKNDDATTNGAAFTGFPPPFGGNFGVPPENGKNGKGQAPPNKGSLYSDGELMDLLQLHQGLSEKITNKPKEESILLPGEKPPSEGSFSLHDLVLQTIGEVDAGKDKEAKEKSVLLPGEEAPSKGSLSLHDLVLQTIEEVDASNDKKADDNDDEIQSKVKDVIAIASDVDGTLLSKDHTLHPRTEQAIRLSVQDITAAEKRLQYFFPATGKTRKGALDSLGGPIRKLLSKLPGVFIQGLYCVDGKGKVVFERKLSTQAVANAEALAKEHGVTVLAYDGDNLYSNPSGDPALVAEIHEKWGEPRPEVIPSLSLEDHPNGFHKLLLVHHNVEKLAKEVRPELQSLANANEASVTVAVPTMLELLPEGCSKQLGVEKLCDALGINPRKQLLAIGDAENDVGMLEMAAIGVAVNNACGLAKSSANVVMEESNSDGGAGAAMEKYSMLGQVIPLHRAEGIFSVIKPLEWTSSDVVSFIRKMLERDARERGAKPGRPGRSKKAIKVGHGGTLDPLATGVLVIGVGKGTKELQRYVDMNFVFISVSVDYPGLMLTVLLALSLLYSKLPFGVKSLPS